MRSPTPPLALHLQNYIFSSDIINQVGKSSKLFSVSPSTPPFWQILTAEALGVSLPIMASAKISLLTLENLPYDPIVEILYSFSSLVDLQALVTASPICFRLFGLFAKSILLRVSQNTIGMDAWEEARTVLIYQRDKSSTCDPADFKILKKELESGFVLCKMDLSRIVANQIFFDSCAKDFAVVVSKNFPRLSPSSAALPPFGPSLPRPSFAGGDVLPIKRFYQVWLLALQFAYESVTTFSHHKSLSSQDYADILVVSQVMFHNKRFGAFFQRPKRMEAEGWKGTDPVTLFRVLAVVHWRVSPSGALVKNHLLFLKMLSHLTSFAISMRVGVNRRNPLFYTMLRGLVIDFQMESVKVMVERYRLFGGWE